MIPARLPKDQAKQALIRVMDRMADEREFYYAVADTFREISKEIENDARKRRPIPSARTVERENDHAREVFTVALDEGKTVDEAAALVRQVRAAMMGASR